MKRMNALAASVRAFFKTRMRQRLTGTIPRRSRPHPNVKTSINAGNQDVQMPDSAPVEGLKVPARYTSEKSGYTRIGNAPRFICS